MPPDLPALRVLILILLIPLAACSARSARDDQLARVAKDWSLALRAAQVLPVFPLTSDLTPGDVFLTTTPVGEEVALFRSRGFLPLETQLTRLDVAEELAALEPATTVFPTYALNVTRAGAASASLPVRGVTVALALRRAERAIAQVTLRDVRTRGLPADVLHEQLREWASDNRQLLAPYARGQPVYVRVVQRVFEAQGVDVALAFAGSAGAAASPALPLPAATEGEGTIAHEDASSVTLRETFAQPVVVGYLVYDSLILPGGEVSSPVPTLQRVQGGREVLVAEVDSAALLASWLARDEATRGEQLERWIARRVRDAPGLTDFVIDDRYEPDRQRALRELGILAEASP